MSIMNIAGAGNEHLAVPGKGRQELGQEDFLKLLVAQLKNQDPSKPVDNAEFLGQIAQFSMVSGIDDLKGSFGAVAGQLYGGQAMQAASLIGKQVLSETSQLRLAQAGDAAEGMIALPAATTSTLLTIQDAAGKQVATLSLPAADAGLQAFRWDGLDEAGESVPAGDYQISAAAFIEGQEQAVAVQAFSRVESVSVDRASQGILLHLHGDRRVKLSQVSEFK